MTEIKNVKSLGSDRIEVTGIRKLHPWEIEYKGSPYNCSYCRNDDETCCDVENEPRCEKCICQSLHSGTNKDGELVPQYQMGCKKCDLSKYDKKYCTDKGLLENDIIQPVVIYDCSQNVLVSGNENEMTDVQLTNACSGNVEVYETRYIVAAIVALIIALLAVFFWA